MRKSCIINRELQNTGISGARITEMNEGRKLKFVNGECKWFIGNFTHDLEKYEQILIFKDVFRHYEFENYPLKYPSTNKESEAQIKIYFVHEDGNVYNSDGVYLFECPEKLDEGTLAIAFSPYGGKWQGFVFINDNLFWSLRNNEKGKHSLFETLLHELGHTHNMDHSTNRNDLMYYMEADNQTWGNDSMNLLFKIYKSERIAALKESKSATMFFDFIKGSKKARKRIIEMFTDDKRLSEKTILFVLYLPLQLIVIILLIWQLFK